MKIGVTGNGNIGSRLIAMGCEPIAVDLLDSESVRAGINKVKPDLIIHTAGISSPEKCEAEPELARSINTFGTNLVCQHAEDLIGEARVVYLSTDHVFDGIQGNYSEEDDPLPVSEYGRTKLAAEGIVQLLYGDKVIRLSRGFDSKSNDIESFGLAIRTGHPVYVPDFIYRSYCHMDFLASSILEYARKFEAMPATLHLGGENTISFYEFIRQVAYGWGGNLKNILPRSTEDKGFSPRPLKGGLNTTLAKSLGIPTYSIKDSINRMYDE